VLVQSGFGRQFDPQFEIHVFYNETESLRVVLKHLTLTVFCSRSYSQALLGFVAPPTSLCCVFNMKTCE